MKALPKRKGNAPSVLKQEIKDLSLNESPSEKEGKFAAAADLDGCVDAASMKALPKRKGNCRSRRRKSYFERASMKALPKRKGNSDCGVRTDHQGCRLNESPSEKEGKYPFGPAGAAGN